MNFQEIIARLAGMLSVQVLEAHQPTPGRTGSVRVGSADDAQGFAFALSRSGIAARTASYRNHHFVYVG